MATTQSDQRPLPDRFKDALSRWASGVSVVATRIDGQIKAATATAFVSVSLNPPLILVSLSHNSRTLTATKQTQQFTVNILSPTQQNLSEQFGSPGDPPEFPFTDDCAIPEAMASLVCKVHELHPAGDHTLMIGLVEQVYLGPTADEALLYFRRAYHSVSKSTQTPK